VQFTTDIIIKADIATFAIMIRFNLNILVILWSANIRKMNINSVLFQTAAIGDYLFLIMIVLASIIQAIAQNRKKKVLLEKEQRRIVQNKNQVYEVMGQKPEMMSGYDTVADNVFDHVDSFLFPEHKEGQHIWGDDYPVTATAEKEPMVTLESTVSPDEKLSPDKTEKHPVLLPQKLAKEISATSYKSGIRNGFSLRKAVIYSEILNRKYT